MIYTVYSSTNLSMGIVILRQPKNTKSGIYKNLSIHLYSGWLWRCYEIIELIVSTMHSAVVNGLFSVSRTLLETKNIMFFLR